MTVYELIEELLSLPDKSLIVKVYNDEMGTLDEVDDFGLFDDCITFG